MRQLPRARCVRSLSDVTYPSDECRQRIPVPNGSRHRLHSLDLHEGAREERERQDNGETNSLHGVRTADQHAHQHAKPREGKHSQKDEENYLHATTRAQVGTPSERQSHHGNGRQT
jgi:hypothetical protein